MRKDTNKRADYFAHRTRHKYGLMGTKYLCKILFSILVVLSFKTVGQESNTFFINICNFDSVITQSQKKIQLIGAYRHKSGSFLFELGYLKKYHSNRIYPKFLFLEGGPAWAYLANKYLESGDDKILKVLYFNSGMNPAILKQIFSYNKTLKEEEKFNIVGIDYEIGAIDVPFFAVRRILLENLEKNNRALFNHIDSVYHDLDKINELDFLLGWIKIKANPIHWSRKSLKKDISRLKYFVAISDSIKLKAFLGKEYNLFKTILNSCDQISNGKFLFSEKNRQNRTYFMASNLYNTFLKDTSKQIIGVLGSVHVSKIYRENWPNSRPFSVAMMLNSDSNFKAANQKVNASLIVYGSLVASFYKRLYKYTNVSEREMRNVFMNMKDCDAYIKKYQDTIIIDNLIYFID